MVESRDGAKIGATTQDTQAPMSSVQATMRADVLWWQ